MTDVSPRHYTRPRHVIARNNARREQRKMEMRAREQVGPSLAPRCSCERPAPHTDLDGHSSCLICGRTPR